MDTPELNEYVSSSKKIQSHRKKVAMFLLQKNQISERDKWIVEHENFDKISKAENLYDGFISMKIKFNYKYISELNSEELNKFLEIKNSPNLLGSKAHIYAVIVKLSENNLIDPPIGNDFNPKKQKNTLNPENYAEYLYPDKIITTDKNNEQLKKFMKDKDKNILPLAKNIIQNSVKFKKSEVLPLLHCLNSIDINIRECVANFIVSKTIKISLDSIVRIFEKFLVTNISLITLEKLFEYYSFDDYRNFPFDVSYFNEPLENYMNIDKVFSYVKKTFSSKDSADLWFRLMVGLKNTNSEKFSKFEGFGEKFEIWEMFSTGQNTNQIFWIFSVFSEPKHSYVHLKQIFIYMTMIISINFEQVRIDIFEDLFIILAQLHGINLNLTLHNRLFLNKITEPFEPAKRVARALLFLNHPSQRGRNLENIFYILSTNLHIPLVAYFIDQPTQNVNIYSQGINVHSGKRDLKTKEAINLLIESWNPTEKDVEKYFNKFWEERHSLNTKQKNALLRVLGVDDNLNLVESGKDEFSGLMTGRITIFDINISPKEFIARFWRFALKSNEPENLKLSIQMGLIDSLQTDKVVCNPGKIQRLVVSALQGRLKKEDGTFVDIDGFSEEIIDKTQEIQNINVIHHYIEPFIGQIFGIEELRPKNITELFDSIFEFIFNMHKNGINLCSKVVIYYFIFVSIDKNGISLNDKLSIASNYEDMFDVDDYKTLYLEKDLQHFKKG